MSMFSGCMYIDLYFSFTGLINYKYFYVEWVSVYFIVICNIQLLYEKTFCPTHIVAKLTRSCFF